MSLCDQADWDGLTLESADVGARTRRRRWRVGGVQYTTEGEAVLARLLIYMGVNFTPDVPIMLLPERSGDAVSLYVPDFVFDREPYVWHWPNGGRSVIHGLEVKGATRPQAGSAKPAKKSFRRTERKIERLRLQRNIVILLLTDREVLRYFERGRLPMKPLAESR